MSPFDIVAQTPSWKVFLVAFAFYALTYLVITASGELLVKWVLRPLGIGRRLEPRDPHRGQVRNEILRSMVTCAMFALTTAVAHRLLLTGFYRLRWSRPAWQIGIEIAGLIVWNELHVYVLHRLMHTRWLLRNVHVIHHRSHSPTAYSVYSVHWIEGILMSLVTPIAMLVHDFQFHSIVIFPVLSLMMNVLCHWNHDLFPNLAPNRWLAMAQRHGMHHTNAHGNFGFTMALFDRLGGTLIRTPYRR